jgi:hypothetical protein
MVRIAIDPPIGEQDRPPPPTPARVQLSRTDRPAASAKERRWGMGPAGINTAARRLVRVWRWQSNTHSRRLFPVIS